MSTRFQLESSYTGPRKVRRVPRAGSKRGAELGFVIRSMGPCAASVSMCDGSPYNLGCWVVTLKLRSDPMMSAEPLVESWVDPTALALIWVVF